MRLALGALLALTVFVAQPAAAQLLPPEHDGFFLRFQVGPGALDASRSSVSVGGVSGTAGFAVGGTIARNLILYGEFTHQTAADPTLEVGGVSQRVDGSSISLSGFGPGLAYYIMPANLYLSATALLSTVEIREGRASLSTDMGFGGRFSIGKEWWVSRDWGLGVALVGTLASVPIEGASTSLSVKGLSLAFSATLN